MDLVEKKDNDVQNPFFKDLVTIMSNPQFRHFYNAYFTDWNEIESIKQNSLDHYSHLMNLSLLLYQKATHDHRYI